MVCPFMVNTIINWSQILDIYKIKTSLHFFFVHVSALNKMDSYFGYLGTVNIVNAQHLSQIQVQIYCWKVTQSLLLGFCINWLKKIKIKEYLKVELKYFLKCVDILTRHLTSSKMSFSKKKKLFHSEVLVFSSSSSSLTSFPWRIIKALVSCFAQSAVDSQRTGVGESNRFV